MRMPRYWLKSSVQKSGELASSGFMFSKYSVNSLRLTKKVLLVLLRLRLRCFRNSSNIYLHSLLRALSKFLFITSALKASDFVGAQVLFLGEVTEVSEYFSSLVLISDGACSETDETFSTSFPAFKKSSVLDGMISSFSTTLIWIGVYSIESS